MNLIIVAARAVHFASAMLLFGEMIFALLVARPAWRSAGADLRGQAGSLHCRLMRVAGWSLAVSLLSSAVWLALQAAIVSGMPLSKAINWDTLGLVLSKTGFGRVFSLRFGFAILLAGLLLALSRAPDDAWKPRWAIGGVALAALYLGALAWTGHATAGKEPQRYIQLFSDVVHLLAAGAWLGALPGLVSLLSRDENLRSVVQATRRFSLMGLICVGALVLSGFVNAWYLVGSVPALIGTNYGQLLLAKLCVFALMVTLAAVNRVTLTPRLEHGDHLALPGLRRNATLEFAAGLVVVAIVAALGITVPGAHQSPIWPFAHTLSFEPAQQSVGIRVAVMVTGALGCLAAVVALAGLWRRRWRALIAGLGGMFAVAAAWIGLLAVPAYPTTYMASPQRYTTDTIVRGDALYATQCRTCHGIDGHGDGPAAASLSIQPANLVEHAPHHRRGDLFWRIGHGVPRTPMPGFASQLADAQIWDLVQFLRAQAQAEQAMALTGNVERWRPIVAPDFTFEVDARGQESLHDNDHSNTVLVLYTLPESLPRLRELAMQRRSFDANAARVIAVPLDTKSTSADIPPGEGVDGVRAATRPDVVAAYAMFARRSTGKTDARIAHAEFLIDRQGYLRGRWLGVPNATEGRSAEQLDQILALNREPPHVPSADSHLH